MVPVDQIWTLGPRAFAVTAAVIVLAIVGISVDTFPLRVHAKPLRVGFNEFRPYISVTSDGHPEGLAIDVIREAARRSGQELSWVKVGDEVAALREGRIDLYPLMTATPETLSRFHFSDYWWQHTLDLVSTDLHPVTRLSGVAGLKVGLRMSDFVVDLAQSILPGAVLVVKPDAGSLLDSLCRGEIGALFVERRSLERERGSGAPGCPNVSSPNVSLKITPVPGATLLLGSASTRLTRNTVDIRFTHINEAVADGTLANLAAAYQFEMPESDQRLAQKVQGQAHDLWLKLTCLGLGCLLVFLGGVAVRMNAANKAAEEAKLKLAESEQRFHAFMDHLSANAFVKDSSGTLVYVNRADAKMFGLTPEECVGKSNFDIMPRALAEELRAHDRCVLESGCERKFNELLTDYEGNVRNWLTYKFPFHNRSGEVFLGGISVEITEMIQVQNALRESESRYRQIVEYAGDIIVRCDRRGRIAYINEMGARVLKFIAVDLRGRRALELIRPEDRKRVIGVLRHELAAGTTDLYIEIPVATGDGTELWLGQTIRMLRTGGLFSGLQAISQDITERRRMEAELRSSEERFRLLYENSPVAYHEIDREGVIRRVNRAECEMLGIPAEELVGLAVVGLMAPSDREIARAAIAAKVAELQPLQPFQRTFIRRDGRRVLVEIHENLRRDAEGRVTGIHSVLLDITQRQVGETLDEDRREISEMIAQRQSLDGILRRISLMISHYDESLCCVPLRLVGQVDEPKLEPVAAGDHVEVLCQAIRELGAEALSLWPSQEFEVSHLRISELAVRPTTARIAAAASQLQMRSCWSIPVVSSANNPLGVLLVFSPRDDQTTPAEDQLLRTTSRIAAVGIENRSLSDLLAFQASHDGLTRLPNRGTFETRLENAIFEARGTGERLAVFYVDLDRFKQVNDTFGHSAGDELLRQVGTRLRRCIRQSDLLARIGGDEFALLLPGLRDPGEASRVAEAILRAFHASFDIGGSETFVTASIGISFFPDDGSDVATLQRNSDTAMYRVKNTGRNSFRCYTGDVRAHAEPMVSRDRKNVQVR